MITNAQPRVLLVDDEWTIRQQLSRAMEAANVPCECAINGDDALERFSKRRHELIVTDLKMPGRHGHWLATALLGRIDPPMVVALTGVTDPLLTKDLIARGVTDVIFKPMNYAVLAKKLKHLLESREGNTVSTPDGEQRQQSLSFEDELKRQSAARIEIETKLLKRRAEYPWANTALDWIDWNRFANPPAEIYEHLSRHAMVCPKNLADRRREARVRVNENAMAVCLGSNWLPTGNPFKIVVRDFSTHSIGFIQSERPTGQWYAISLKGLAAVRITVLAQVLSCQHWEDYFDIVAMFLLR
jgi:DNA-binding response OmpR family regulator